VSFNEGATKVLTVANTGQVPVQYEFIKKHRDSKYCKPWLTCEPYTGFLMPGDNSYITLEVLVDKRTAWSLNSGLDELYDILVLHLDGGKDIFITVSGQYQKSCFGCSIEALIQMHQPISQVAPGTVCQYEKGAYPSVDPGNDSDSKQPVLAVPKELW
jgi:phosphatidylinositol-bisphosphatase